MNILILSAAYMIFVFWFVLFICLFIYYFISQLHDLRKWAAIYLEGGSPEFFRKESDNCIFLIKIHPHAYKEHKATRKEMKLLPIEKYM